MSPDRVVGTGTCHDRRGKHEVLCDARVHQLLEDDSGISDVEQALNQGRFREELRDDRIYLIEKNLYYTGGNVNQSNLHKIDAGPEKKGLAGDIDVGYIDLNSYEIRNIELKSNRMIPPVDSLGEDDRTPSCVKEGRKTNRDILELLDTFERNDNFHVPYNPSVEVWNGVMDSVKLDEIPKYSEHGNVIASEEAVRRAENNPDLEKLNYVMFKKLLFGGGDIITEDELAEEYR